MCGIFGVCYTEDSKGKEEWTTNEIAQLMFPAIRHRGPHAFGWMTWDGESPIQYAKHDGDVSRMSNLAEVKVDDNARWLVGHVRYATHGRTDDMRNNHPIPHGDVIGVHNGVLANYQDILDETGRDDPETEVDSEAIFAAVNKWGHRAGLRKVQGDMAAVYARFSKPEFLYFAKSHGRPLIFARTKAGSLVFASELKVLTAAFGNELHDVRELHRNQLVRVAGGKVMEACTYRTDPPKPRAAVIRPVISTPRISGITDYMATTTVPSSAMAQNRMSKKQRRRARNAEAIRREEARQEALRDAERPDGFYCYKGMCVTAEEYELLREYEEQTD